MREMISIALGSDGNTFVPVKFLLNDERGEIVYANKNALDGICPYVAALAATNYQLAGADYVRIITNF